MSHPVIRVENLGKKYVLRHQRPHRYSTLRDAIASGVRSWVDPFRLQRPSRARSRPQEEFWALQEVGFEVGQGDRVGIIGRNGAGKSTLLKILSRITEPSTGEIRIRGRVASLLEVGTGFHPELSGRENIFLNGAILGMSKAEINRKFDEIVAFAEVEKFLDTPVKHYSSGMYVRLAFAVAAHLEPEILIVDEVLAVGDAAFQKKCLGRMKDIGAEGRTVLFVSHSMAAITEFCDTAIFLEKGHVRDQGAIHPIVTAYLSDLFQNKISDLSELRLPGMGKEIRFSQIELRSDLASSLNFGDSIVCDLVVESDINIEDLILGVSIYSINGNCIGSLLSNETFSMKSGCETPLYLEISNTSLAPGTYHIGFGLGQKGTQKIFDAVIGKPSFQILPVSESELGESPISKWQPGWGNIVFNEHRVKVEQ